MPRGLDHLVLAVRDLDAAGRFYETLGFTVGARNRHPWGTENRLVQFPGIFLELIAVGEGAVIAPHEPPHRFSFGAFVRDYLSRREGFAMLVLESDDAEADRAAFARAGIGDFETFFFERQAKRPDGSAVRVAFSLAFANNRLAPEVGFFVCQQHVPENFWNPAFQQHANGACRVTAVTMVAENPSAQAEFLHHFTGEQELVSTSAGITIRTPRGRLEVMTGPALAFHTGVSLPEEPARLVGFTVAVPSLAALAARVRAAELPHYLVGTCLVVPPEAAFGTLIVFSEESAGPHGACGSNDIRPSGRRFPSGIRHKDYGKVGNLKKTREPSFSRQVYLYPGERDEHAHPIWFHTARTGGARRHGGSAVLPVRVFPRRRPESGRQSLSSRAGFRPVAHRQPRRRGPLARAGVPVRAALRGPAARLHLR
ncbi:VOC family protein [Archangium sp.]|uniref:VOC family protein n=1 Tax=Archangium sp. TaxID=1872627 RepID=UPI002D24A2CE|nr:VOC family protein [Archangium sp.]HYO53922.1 VOC family protein [Archangium sp.]